MWIHLKEGKNYLHFEDHVLKGYLIRLRYHKIKYSTKHLVNLVFKLARKIY